MVRMRIMPPTDVPRMIIASVRVNDEFDEEVAVDDNAAVSAATVTVPLYGKHRYEKKGA